MRREGAGLGANYNIPLPLGSGDDAYMTALADARKTLDAFAPGALVVALGLDACEHDPLKGWRPRRVAFGRSAGIAKMGLPTVIVQEGGYLSDVLGDNLTAFPRGI